VFRRELDTVEIMSRHGLAVMTATLVAWSAGGCASSFKASTVDGAVKASNAFGFDFYREVRKREVRKGTDNLVCSPTGAAIALTMVAAGARGTTQTEMLHALHIDPANLDQTYASFAAVLDAVKARDGKDGLVLSMADRVWVQQGLKLQSEYQSLLRDAFRAPIVELDFVKENAAALAAINQWSSEETHGLIPRILETVSGPVVLANAIYMLGEWRQPFAESATADDKFTNGKGETSVRMMRQVSDFRYAKVRGAKLVELPYKGELSMIVVLPDDVDGLETIEDRAASSYSNWIAAMEDKRVNLKLPHFTTTTDLDLRGAMEAMGIRQAFSEGADFSGMTRGRGLYIGRAIQKAWIETSEKGTKAAAVTLVEMEGDSDTVGLDRPPPVVFHADHPFMYLIRDVKSGEILFIGRVVKPAE
jgi:serpin B